MKEIEGKTHYPLDLEALPQGWTLGWVGDVTIRIQPGFASGAHNKSGDGIPHIRPMNISRNGSIDLSEIKYVARTAGDRRLHAGDVLFNNTNSPVLIGKTAVVTTDQELAYSNHMTRLVPSEGVDPRFVAHQLHYLWMSGYFLHRCVKHVNQASISSKPLAQTVPLVIAPTSEQDRIVEAIETQFARLDAAVETLKRVQVNLKRYRASVLKAAVEGRLVPTEAELAHREGRDYEPASVLLERILGERRRRWEEAELNKMKAKGKEPKNDKWKAKYKEPAEPDTSGQPELPEGWCWATVDALAEVQGGLAKGKKRKPTDQLVEVPYLRVANVQRGFLDLSVVKTIMATEREIQVLRLEPGDVLFNEGGDRDKLGRGWVWNGEISDCIHQNHVFRARLFTADVLPTYLSRYANSTGQRYFLAEGKQTTNLASISLTKLRSLPVPLPPLAEQKRLSGELDDLMSIAETSEASIERDLIRCQRLRQSILKWAFEGKLVDQDPGDEPASVLLERIRSETASRPHQPRAGKPRSGPWHQQQLEPDR